MNAVLKAFKAVARALCALARAFDTAGGALRHHLGIDQDDGMVALSDEGRYIEARLHGEDVAFWASRLNRSQVNECERHIHMVQSPPFRYINARIHNAWNSDLVAWTGSLLDRTTLIACEDFIRRYPNDTRANDAMMHDIVRGFDSRRAAPATSIRRVEPALATASL